MKSRLLFLPLAALWPASLPAGMGESDFFSSLGFGLLLAVIVTLLAAPYFYRRSLEKRGDKNLSRFLMNDPKMRDAIIETRTGKKPSSQDEDQPAKGEADKEK